MNREEVSAWLDRYIDAWKSRDPEQIGALFTEDAVYRYRPYPGGKTLVGQQAIVQGWLSHLDGPDDWEASYRVFAVEGDAAVAVGTTRYLGRDGVPDDVFHNCFLLGFGTGGRCAEFTEYWVLEPKEDEPG
ncbi:MAG TPA: nuclear transport factor 2 family protein [Acidimicrobiia bacterium]|nr:nuclear transport factor 2 family protein [Acidimicrobiia bacterium]